MVLLVNVLLKTFNLFTVKDSWLKKSEDTSFLITNVANTFNVSLAEAVGPTFKSQKRGKVERNECHTP